MSPALRVSERTSPTKSPLTNNSHIRAWRCVPLLDFLDLRHESVVGNQRLSSSEDILVTNNTLLIHDEIRSLSQTSLAIEHPIDLNRLELGIIADERKVQLQKIGKGALRKSQIGTDPNNFRVHLLKIGVVVPTGRQFLDSCGSKI